MSPRLDQGHPASRCSRIAALRCCRAAPGWGFARALGTPKASQAGRYREQQFVIAVVPPRMKPRSRCRHRINEGPRAELASFASTADSGRIYFNQADSVPSFFPLRRRCRRPDSRSHHGDSRLLVRSRPVARIAACGRESLPNCRVDRGEGGRPCNSRHGSASGLGNTELSQGRSNDPDEHMFRSVAGDNEAADASVVAGLNEHASGEVDGLRRRGSRRRADRRC